MKSKSESFAGVLPDEFLGSMPLPLPVSGKKRGLKGHALIVVDSEDSEMYSNFPDSRGNYEKLRSPRK